MPLAPSDFSGLDAASSLLPGAIVCISQDQGVGLTSYKILASDLSTLSKFIDVATNYTSAGERYIFVTDVTTIPVPRTITLSTVDFIAHRSITIKDKTNLAGTNEIIILTQGVEPINTTLQRVQIKSDGGEITLVSDGSTWNTIGHDDGIMGDSFERIESSPTPIRHQDYRARADGAGNPAVLQSGDVLATATKLGFDGIAYLPLHEQELSTDGVPAGTNIPTKLISRKRPAGAIGLIDYKEIDAHNNVLMRAPVSANSISTMIDQNTTDHNMIFVNPNGAPRNITLATTNKSSGYFVDIVDTSGTAGTFNITLTPQSGLINGQATAVISANYGAARVRFDGTNFFLV